MKTETFLYQLGCRLAYSCDNEIMKTVGAFEAKTHLNQLLQRAAKGETISITRRGVPVAKLTPPDGGDRTDARSLADSIRQLRTGAVLDKKGLGKITIKELIDEGRRY